MGGPRQIHNCATNGGITPVTAALAVALSPRTIRVDAVLPAGVSTDFNGQHRASRAWSNPGRPIDRVGGAWDIAGAVFYLASGDAVWLPVDHLPVDGNLMVRP